MTATLHHGNCLDILTALPDASIDAVITDPPYSLGFMNRKWDTFTPAEYQAFTTHWATECLRLLKPGGHLFAFGGTRTSHRLTGGIEDAGFDIRDTITWLYFQGFPKSADVAKAIDKAAGAQREVIRPRSYELANDGGYSGGLNTNKPRSETAELSAPATDDAKTWSGWGTALKPASEPIVVARKPFKGSVASNVLTHGTGALNIDGCRIETSAEDALAMQRANSPGSHRMKAVQSPIGTFTRSSSSGPLDTTKGRWPANVVLSHDGDCADECVPDCAVAELDAQSGGHAVVGGASRFFPTFRYQAKAPSRERPKVDGVAHPTVKPLALMRWLVNLVAPAGALILDPFAGSGTTLEAAVLEGVNAIGIEADATYIPLIEQRLARAGAALTLSKDTVA